VRPSGETPDEEILDTVGVEYLQDPVWSETRSGSAGTTRRSVAASVDLLEKRDHLVWSVESTAVSRDRNVVIGRRPITGQLPGAVDVTNDLGAHVTSVRRDHLSEVVANPAMRAHNGSTRAP
jgi:hypothetical protein